jgi:hypothetical protein
MGKIELREKTGCSRGVGRHIEPIKIYLRVNKAMVAAFSIVHSQRGGSTQQCPDIPTCQHVLLSRKRHIPLAV